MVEKYLLLKEVDSVALLNLDHVSAIHKILINIKRCMQYFSEACFNNCVAWLLLFGHEIVGFKDSLAYLLFFFYTSPRT